MIDSDSAPDLVLDLTTAGEHRFTKYHDHYNQDSHDYNQHGNHNLTTAGEHRFNKYHPHIYDNQDSHDYNHGNHESHLYVIMALFKRGSQVAVHDAWHHY